MACIVDLKFDLIKRVWTAKPRFANPAWGAAENAPSCTERLLPNALYGLCDKLPIMMANAYRKVYPRGIYASPERELGSEDKCIEADGHRPSQEEFNRRHFAYMRDQLVKQYTVQS